MENKTIRVWDKEVNNCDDCNYSSNPDWDNLGGWLCNQDNHTITSGFNIGICSNCPFSKPLTKEDIESCGFTFTNVLHCDSDEFIEGYEKYVSLTDRIIIHETKESGICIYKCHCYNEISGNWEQTDLFRGTVDNLSEFKLLLKQLNIA